MASSAGVTSTPGPLRFVFGVSLNHVVSYLVAGLIAARALDYPSVFEMPVIEDYYLPYGTVDPVLSVALQVVRGAIFGLVLAPFRQTLAASRWGWLWLWLLFLGIGILGTPAAAPGSLEGVLYTRLPLWFHLLGLPEMTVQTLAFSLLTHRTLRAAEHPLPAGWRTALNAVAVACIAFLGYTAVSLAFAFAAGVSMSSGSDPRVLGQFVAPLLITASLVAVPGRAWWLAKHAAMYALSAGALATYQALVLGSVGWLYVLLAPILPAVISALMTRPRTPHLLDP